MGIQKSVVDIPVFLQFLRDIPVLDIVKYPVRSCFDPADPLAHSEKRGVRIEETSRLVFLDDLVETLQKIHVARAFNSSHQMLLVEKAAEMAVKTPIRLLIVDSLTAHFRSEYVGRGTLAERQGLLNKHMHDLLRFGDVANAVIAVTNQVAAKPDAFFGDPTRPV